MAALFKQFDTFGILHRDLTIIFRAAVKSQSCRILPSLQVFPTVTTQHRSYARSASSNDSSNNNRSGRTAYARTKAPAGNRSKKDVVYKQIVDIIRKGSLTPIKLCTAYSTGERYNLQALKKGLDERKYMITNMPEDLNDVIHTKVITAPDKTSCGEVFMFKQGVLVCWGLPESEILYLRTTMKKYQEEAYKESLVDRETEQFPFCHMKQPSTLFKGRIILSEEGCEETRMLEKYAFSNALALSVKLAMWESALDEYADSIKWVPEVLKQGKKLRLSRKQVLSKRGELISLRYKTNLYSDLLMTPDFYWDRSELESVYTIMVFHLEIDRRTKVLNEKLNYCSELADLLTSHLNEKHSNTLEMGIIALIAVEVIFEVIHLVMRFVEGY